MTECKDPVCITAAEALAGGGPKFLQVGARRRRLTTEEDPYYCSVCGRDKDGGPCLFCYPESLLAEGAAASSEDVSDSDDDQEIQGEDGEQGEEERPRLRDTVEEPVAEAVA